MAELGLLVLCKRPIEVQRLADRLELAKLARERFPDSSTSAVKLIDSLLAEAIDSIDIDVVDQAADALLTNRYGNRWVALADRQERAADAISDLSGGSLTRDGFRRKRTTDGRSHQDDVLEHVALAVLELTVGPTAQPVDEPVGDEPVGDEPAVTGRSSTVGRRSAAAAALVVGIALIAVGLVLVERRGATDADDEAPRLAYDCSIAAGEAVPGLDATPEQIEYLGRTLADHLDETGMACPDQLADFWPDTELIVQRLSSSSTRWSGALVATPGKMGFTLTTGQWSGLLDAHELASAGNNPDFVPFDEEHRMSPSWVQADAGWLVGERWGQPHFLVYGPWQRAWERSGGLDGRLGRPTSSVYPERESFRQDFERGNLTSIGGNDPAPRYGAATTPPPVQPGDRIVQPDGTEWLIGTDGRRIWTKLIPDGLPTGCSSTDLATLTDDHTPVIHRIDGTRAARVPLSSSCTF